MMNMNFEEFENEKAYGGRPDQSPGSSQVVVGIHWQIGNHHDKRDVFSQKVEQSPHDPARGHILGRDDHQTRHESDHNPTGIDFSFDELSGKPEPVQRGFAAVSTFVTGVL